MPVFMRILGILTLTTEPSFWVLVVFFPGRPEGLMQKQLGNSWKHLMGSKRFAQPAWGGSYLEGQDLSKIK